MRAVHLLTYVPWWFEQVGAGGGGRGFPMCDVWSQEVGDSVQWGPMHHGSGHIGTPPPRDQTDTTENITFL